MNTDEERSDGLAARLQVAREQAGLSQGQVAKLLQMHRPTISEIEAGRRKVSAEELARFAVAYDVDIAWLHGVNQENKVADDRLMLAARELAKLKEDDLDRVIALLSSLRKSEGPE